VVHVALSWRLRWSQVEDGRVDEMDCVGPSYSCFAVLFLLGYRGIIVI
jgi:hypothetical protein